MIRARFVGWNKALNGCTALLCGSGIEGLVLAQFDYTWTTKDSPIEAGPQFENDPRFGWHLFPVLDFVRIDQMFVRAIAFQDRFVNLKMATSIGIETQDINRDLRKIIAVVDGEHLAIFSHKFAECQKELTQIVAALNGDAT